MAGRTGLEPGGYRANSLIFLTFDARNLVAGVVLRRIGCTLEGHLTPWTDGVRQTPTVSRYDLVAMKYKIALHESEEGFSVSVPGLPGCWSQGESEEEALRNIQDAIQEYLAAVDELLQGATVREVDVAASVP